MIIAIDLDGTILDEWLNPIEGSKESIKFLIEQGHKPYVLTARDKEDHEYVKRLLKTYRYPKLEVTNRKKLHTRMIIDDRAVRFTNWQDIRKYFG